MPQFIELGIALVILGLVLALLAVIVMFAQGLKTVGGKTRGGGVLLIGPIPIIFGSDKRSLVILVALSVILMVVAILFQVVR